MFHDVEDRGDIIDVVGVCEGDDGVHDGLVDLFGRNPVTDKLTGHVGEPCAEGRHVLFCVRPVEDPCFYGSTEAVGDEFRVLSDGFVPHDVLLVGDDP